jgi:membrane protease YdiL (CAAX protease family)
VTAVAAVSGAHVDGVLRLLGILLAGYLVLGQPVVGGWSHARFRRTLGTDPRALLGRYRRTAVIEWSLVAAALALVAAAPGMDLPDIGVRWPRLSAGGAPYTMVGLGGLGLSVLLLAALRRRVDDGVPVTAPADVLALLPRGTRERRAFAAVAVTAGVCEETLYRGVLLALAAALAPGLPAAGLAVLSAVAFGLAHAYQGALGALTTAVLGACLAVLYLGSGSLLLPVLYHVLVDLRVLVLAVGRDPSARDPSARHTPGRHAARGDDGGGHR